MRHPCRALPAAKVINMFLSREELEALTGYKIKSKQRAWLIDNGFRFSVRCDGFPCVLRTHVESVLGGDNGTAAREEMPDAAALLSVING